MTRIIRARMLRGVSVELPRSDAQILIADRDRELVTLIGHTLQRAGLRFTTAHDETSALEVFTSQRPSVILTDTNGLDLLAQFRAAGRETAIIILTAPQGEEARVSALESGADDYLTKPFSHRELVARIRACLRHTPPESRADDRYAGDFRVADSRPDDSRDVSRIVVGHLIVDTDQHLVTYAGHPLHLSRMEFRVLHYLMLRAGTVVPAHALLREFWRSEDLNAKNAMRVTLHRLRRKLQPSSLQPRVLEAIPRMGFRLIGEVAA
jgi:two-component system, OmpR family, KDP operon response regulator KdpE